MASGVNIKPVTFRLLRMAAGVCGMVIVWLFLPGLPAIVIGGILFFSSSTHELRRMLTGESGTSVFLW